MKKKSKVLSRLSAVFAAVLCVCMLCVPAFASDGEDELLDYGIFEQRDYRQFWNGSFASEFPFIFVFRDGGITIYDKPLVSTEVSSNAIKCKTESTSVIELFCPMDWSRGYSPDSFWANSPIYDLSGNQVYTPTSLGQVDSSTGMLDYGGFSQVDYRDFVVGSLAEKFPYVVVTTNVIYLYSKPIDAYVLGENLLFRMENMIEFNPNGIAPTLIPNEFWYNHNITDAQGNVVYKTHSLYFMKTFVTDIGIMSSNAISWVGTVAKTIVSHPILLASGAVIFVGLGIALYKRLTKV